MNVTEKIKFKVNYLETDVNIILKYEIESIIVFLLLSIRSKRLVVPVVQWDLPPLFGSKQRRLCERQQGDSQHKGPQKGQEEGHTSNLQKTGYLRIF